MTKASPQINENRPLDKACSTADGDRKKIIQTLHVHGPTTTGYFRNVVGVFSVAPRILELRALGHDIITRRRYEKDITGRKHYQGEYVLMPSNQEGI